MMKKSHACDIIDLKTIIKPKYTFKILLIGESDVGKTCMAQRCKDNTFTFIKTLTFGKDNMKVTFQIDKKENEIVILDIWDTCGQEKYKSVMSSFYVKASLAIIMYSITK